MVEHSRRSVRAAGLILALVLTACARGGPGKPDAVRVTEEEAALVVAGELVRLYGLPADPVPVRVRFTREDLGGQPVWRVDAVVEVTLDGRRVRADWTFWVGQRDGRPAVVRSAGPGRT